MLAYMYLLLGWAFFWKPHFNFFPALLNCFPLLLSYVLNHASLLWSVVGHYEGSSHALLRTVC